MDIAHLEQLAKLIRYFILISTSAAQSGHPTSSLSAVELMTALYFGGILKFDLDQPDNPHNDRVIFSKGHASPLMYALYAAAGKVSQAELLTLRQFDSPLEGHPSMRFPYTEATTGSLGQGLGIGVGVALNAKYLDHSPSITYVLLGDSEMAEGANYEAMELAHHYQLNNLVGIIDVNRLGQRGETMAGEDLLWHARKAKAFGWQTFVIEDGHDFNQILSVLEEIRRSTIHGVRPSMIVAGTKKGRGVSLWEDQENWHSKQLNEQQLATALQEVGAFDKNLKGIISSPEKSSPFTTLSADSSHQAQPATPDYSQPTTTKLAAAQGVVKAMSTHDRLVVLDAEVSNSTHFDLAQKAFPDRFFEMFIAEQNMVGVATGLSSRGKIPVVSTFAAFLTRAHDQIRMSQYAETNIKFFGSYAGVSLGKDGFSQMGLEDIALFRSMLNTTVLQPADAVSAYHLAQTAINQPGNVYLRTVREPTPLLYELDETFEVGGSKTLKHSSADKVTVIAAGITVHEALKAYGELLRQGISIRVIDLYSLKPIDHHTLERASIETQALITVEDHFPEGGIGEAVRSALPYCQVPIYSLAVSKTPRSGLPQELLAYEEIDAAAIVKKVKEIVR
ncbi:MAG TPA: transketolase [Patescibacteria group bacterium]